MVSDLEIRILLYVILGCVLGIVYSLRRMYSMERVIRRLELQILAKKPLKKKR